MNTRKALTLLLLTAAACAAYAAAARGIYKACAGWPRLGDLMCRVSGWCALALGLAALAVLVWAAVAGWSPSESDKEAAR